MADLSHYSKIKAGEKDLRGADLRGADLTDLVLRKVNFRKAKLQGADFTGADLQGADFRGATFDSNMSFKNADLRRAVFSNYAEYDTIWTKAKLEGAQGIVLDRLYSNDYDKKVHIGDTVEEVKRKEEERENIEWLKDSFAKDKKKLGPIDYLKRIQKDFWFHYQSHFSKTDSRRGPSEMIGSARVWTFTDQFWDEFHSLAKEEKKKAELGVEEWYAKKRDSRLKKERNREVSDLMNQVDKAKTDKELEALAQEVGELQAQPEYVKDYKKVLNDLQAEIEEKYSLLGKGMRYLKKMFTRGRRASQIRTASRMLDQINKEISDLKNDL